MALYAMVFLHSLKECLVFGATEKLVSVLLGKFPIHFTSAGILPRSNVRIPAVKVRGFTLAAYQLGDVGGLRRIDPILEILAESPAYCFRPLIREAVFPDSNLSRQYFRLVYLRHLIECFQQCQIHWR